MIAEGVPPATRQQPFVSQLVPYALEQIRTRPSSEGGARIGCAAVVMFADVSGFTAWTERLSIGHQRGAEEVASRLNSHFEEMLDVVDRWGGLVHGFAGDATIAAWPVDRHDDPSRALRQSVGCALEIQTRMQAAADPSTGLMPQRVAIGAGDLALDRVGGVDGRWHLLAGGSVWERVIAADEQAGVGDVVVSAPGLLDLADGVAATQVGGCWRIERIDDLYPVAATGIEPPARHELDPFVAVGTLEQLAVDHADWLAEFRRVTSMFVLLHDEPSALPLETAQRIDTALQRAVADHDGDLVYLRYDDKGLVALVAFGTAQRSHENDSERALHLAERLHRDLAGQTPGIRIGLSTGKVFAGLVGGAGYREYTVHGEVVNRAARLMKCAPQGTTVCDRSTRDLARHSFDFDDLEPVTVKGVAEPVVVYRPAGTRRIDPRPTSAALVGRVNEISVLDGLIGSLTRDSEMRVVNLRGEAGVGKSALIDHVRATAEARGVRVVLGAGDSIRRADPYRAWRQVFSDLTEGDDSLPARRRIRDHWWGDRRASLLGVVLDDAPTESAFVSRLDAAGRADTAREFVVEVLGDLLGAGPALVVLDDVQWLDSASWQLLELFVRRSAGALVVTASRPLDAEELPSEARRLLGSAVSSDLALGPLSRAETDALVADRLGVPAISRELGRRVFDRTEGHALFTEQLVLSLSDQGLIRVDSEGAHFAPGPGGVGDLDFPAGVEAVVTGRVDQLDPAVQLTLKVASVAGREFARDLIAGIHPIDSSIPRLDRHLDELEHARLIERVPGRRAESHRFRHVIIRDAAYGLLISAQQRQLHRAVAEQLERQVGDVGSEASVLAHHWSRAEVDERAIHYLDLAGRQALGDHANIEARRFLLDALSRSDGRPEFAGPTRRASWNHLLGRADINLGAYSEAKHHLTDAVAILDAPMPRTSTEISSGLLRQILHHVRVRRGTAPPVDDSELAMAAADSYAMLAEIHYNNHHLESALYATVRGANLALRSPGDSPVAATLQSNLAIAATSAPSWLRQADHYSAAALDMAERLDDPPTWAQVLLVIGTYEFGEGRWAGATEHYEGAMISAAECGERKLHETAAGGLANVHRLLGNFVIGDAVDQQVWNSGRDRGVAQSQVWGGYGRVSALCSLNRFDDLSDMLDSFGRLLDEPGVREQVSASNVVAYLTTRALLDFHDGNDRAAFDAIDGALVEVGRLRSLQSYMCCTTSYLHDAVMAAWRREPTNSTVLEWAEAMDRFAGRCAKLVPIGGPRALLTAGDLHLIRGRVPAARRSWRKALRLSERLAMPFEAAQAHHTLSTRAELSADQATGHRRAADRLLRRLAIDEPFAWTV